MRVDLPNGHWVELRDPEAVTNRDRMRYKRERVPRVLDQVAREQGVSAGSLGAAEVGTRLAEVVAVDMITAWSFEVPIPSEDLSAFENDAFDFSCYDAIIDACDPLIEALKGTSFAPKKGPDGRQDRSTPTRTSAGSKRR